MLLKCFFFRLAPLKISEILPLTPFIISRLVTKTTENTVKETNVPVLAKKRMATLIFFGFKKNIPSSIKNANRFREKNVISTIVPVFALNVGWNWNQGKLFRGVLSLSEKVNTRRMSQPDMESIFHIKNQWNILVIETIVWLIKIIKIKCFYPARILD